jgi:CheY-like chemotaxis protein
MGGFVHSNSIRRDGYKAPKKLDSGGTRAECAGQNTSEQSFPQAGTSDAKNGSAAKLKVLIADDERVIADTLAAILNRFDFDARAVYNGRAAVDALSSFEPDILISDVIMPEMSGIEAAVAILAQRPDCKVVLFSGQAGTANLLHDAQAQGACFEILTKPVHPVDLLAKLRGVGVRQVANHKGE